MSTTYIVTESYNGEHSRHRTVRAAAGEIWRARRALGKAYPNSYLPYEIIAEEDGVERPLRDWEIEEQWAEQA